MVPSPSALVRRALLIAVPVVVLAAAADASAATRTALPAGPVDPSRIASQGPVDDILRGLQRLTLKVKIRGTKLIRSTEVKTAKGYLSTARKARKRVVDYWCDQWLAVFDYGRRSDSAAVASWVYWTHYSASARTGYWSCRRLLYLPILLYS